MEKECIIFKLEITRDKIKGLEELISFHKKSDIQLLAIGISALIMISITSYIDKNINSLEVVSLSLLVCTIYKIFNDAMTRNLDNKHNLKVLKIEKEYYEDLLKQENNL